MKKLFGLFQLQGHALAKHCGKRRVTDVEEEKKFRGVWVGKGVAHKIKNKNMCNEKTCGV